MGENDFITRKCSICGKSIAVNVDKDVNHMLVSDAGNLIKLCSPIDKLNTLMIKHLEMHVKQIIERLKKL